MENGYRALAVMEMHLAKYPFFVDHRCTVADIALYAYTHVAHLCDFELDQLPAIRDWLSRVEAEPRHVTMEWEPQTMAAAQ
jgi:glutathione S-transferase